MKYFARVVFTSLALSLISITAAPAAEGWLTDFEAAKAQSAEKGVPILAEFTGSDWCIWCKRLNNEVLTQDEFKQYAQENLVLFMADFPRGKQIPAEVEKQNKALLQQYGVQGFPTVLLLDKDGNVIERTGYRRGGAQEYVEHLKDILKS